MKRKTDEIKRQVFIYLGKYFHIVPNYDKCGSSKVRHIRQIKDPVGIDKKMNDKRVPQHLLISKCFSFLFSSTNKEAKNDAIILDFYEILVLRHS